MQLRDRNYESSSPDLGSLNWHLLEMQKTDVQDLRADLAWSINFRKIKILLALGG